MIDFKSRIAAAAFALCYAAVQLLLAQHMPQAPSDPAPTEFSNGPMLCKPEEDLHECSKPPYPPLPQLA